MGELGTADFLLCWHHRQQRWAGGRRFVELLRSTIQDSGRRVVVLEAVGKSPDCGEIRFWWAYVAMTLLHALLVFASTVHISVVRRLRPMAQCLKRRISRWILPRGISRNSAIFTFEIGKSLLSHAGRSILWLPDLQHRHYPGYFSCTRWLNREINWRH